MRAGVLPAVHRALSFERSVARETVEHLIHAAEAVFGQVVRTAAVAILGRPINTMIPVLRSPLSRPQIFT